MSSSCAQGRLIINCADRLAIVRNVEVGSARSDLLRRGQTLRVLLKPFDAEQLRANRWFRRL
jgi:hypothetical protein